MIMSCPVCEGQGNIYKAMILDLGIEIRICDECEACWPQSEIVNIKNFKGLASFLKENGLTYEKAKIEDLEYVEL